MPRRLSRKRALLLAFVISAASCGPSSHELAQAREAERLRNVAESEKVLKAFAEKHGAKPVDILDPKITERVSTAHLQDELEGSAIAFRGSLLDIVRGPSDAGEYELIIGERFIGGTVATLKVGKEAVAPLLAMSVRESPAVLVAARVERVVPLVLRLEPCRETDCTEVGLDVNSSDRTYRVVGAVIALQLER